MTKRVELRRHTDNDGDELTAQGIEAALEIGGRLSGDYEVVVSTGAQRATQTAACMLAAGCQGVPRGVVVDTELRSDREDRWKKAYQEAGSGRLSAFRSVAPEFVAEETSALGEALRRVLDDLEEGGTALVIGHSPTTEAAVFGLTGHEVDPLSKGAGVVVEADGDRFAVREVD